MPLRPTASSRHQGVLSRSAGPTALNALPHSSLFRDGSDLHGGSTRAFIALARDARSRQHRKGVAKARVGRPCGVTIVETGGRLHRLNITEQSFAAPHACCDPGTARTGPRLAPVCVARQRGMSRRARAPKSGNAVGDAGRDAPADDVLDGRGGTPGQARSEGGQSDGSGSCRTVPLRSGCLSARGRGGTWRRM